MTNNIVGNDNSKKYWLMALDDMEKEKFSSAVINIKFALQFETDSDAKEIFEQYLENYSKGNYAYTYFCYFVDP